MRPIDKNVLKSGTTNELRTLCATIREEILSTVSVRGGHLSSNLGTVELTVALHRVFDFPKDKLVFDVGHQCYTHKLLSDRAERFGTLRTEGGISGFPKRSESAYDCYDTGHAGTAISAALGIAKARDLKGEDFFVIALVGDGSFNNGLIFEALNSLHILNTNILIVLNDNGMSISPTVGGTHDILNDLKGDLPPAADKKLFEQFGLTYMGVVAGNDLEALLPALAAAKAKLQTGSVLLHVVTKKGQGYDFCENAPDLTHGLSPAAPRHEYSTALGEELCRLAENDARITAVTAAMTDSLGLRPFFDRFPNRAFDVGICEEHASVLSAALAAEGMKPYYAIYSTFLQRAFDEIVHDICGQSLPVTLCIDRAGITGADGETHQGVFDLSYLSFIPNLAIAIPKDIGEFRAMLRWSVNYPKPLAIRYPREGTEGKIGPVSLNFEVLHSTTSDIVLLAAGERCLRLAEAVRGEAAAAGKDFTLINARFLRPLDEKLLEALPQHHVLTLEDNAVIGGLGDAVARFYRGRNIEKRVQSFGYPDRFLPHGTPCELMEEFGLGKAAVLRAVEDAYAGR